MKAYYNENDKHAAQWLRNLIADGLVADGDVDERSIVDVRPKDLKGYGQCHFFAGIGGWSYALRLAGVPDDMPIWTGSCPCQPFSTAGKMKGTSDERHLWPVFRDLIQECNPAIVFGEQVAQKPGRDWFSSVRLDLEALGYAVGGADLCAAGAGAPHVRQRLFWLAYNDRTRMGGWGLSGSRREAEPLGAADSNAASRQLADDLRKRDGMLAGDVYESTHTVGVETQEEHATVFCGADSWRNVEYVNCLDGKSRPTQPGIWPLVDGLSYKVGSGRPEEGTSRKEIIRGYGNAIVPQVAAIFIKSAFETFETL